MHTGILEPDGFSEAALDILSSVSSVTKYNGENLESFLSELDVLFIRLRYKIDESFLRKAPHLKYLVSPTTGHTHLVQTALQSRGIKLISLAGETNFLEQVRATPEHTLGLIIALLRRYRKAFLDEINSDWDRNSRRGEEISGTRIGIVGLGRVGRIVARYLKAMDAKVYWYDPSQDCAGPQFDHRFSSLMELIDASRVIVLCASYTPGDKPLLGRDEVAALNGRYLVNTARGELIDEESLFEAIEAQKLAGVAVDVIANEQTNPFLSRWLSAAQSHGVILTPHIAGATWQSMRNTEEFIANKFVRAISAEGSV